MRRGRVPKTLFWPWLGWAVLLLGALGCGEGKEGGDPLSDGDREGVLETPEGETTDDREEALENEEEGPDGRIEADLLPYVHLSERGVLPASPMPWPRESDWGPGTLRDGRTDTGFRFLPEGGDLIADLRVIAGESLEVLRLSGRFEKVSTVRVRLSSACGLEPFSELDWTDLDRPVEIGAFAGCVTLSMTGEAGAVLWDYSMIGRVEEAFSPLPSAALLHSDRPYPYFGVIEGFYGVPWSWLERKRMLALMARHGLGLYLYAPKNDPFHRDRWREPYPEDQMAAFSDLATYARSLNRDLYFGISPLIDYDPETPSDYAALLDKLRLVLGFGMTGVALLADDIEFAADLTVDASLGALHADLANRLLADLRADDPQVKMLFCPTAYSDSRATEQFEKGWEYLEALQALHPDIQILWTGRATSSSEMTGSEMDHVSDATGRPPLIWDNFYANDGGDGFTGRILLGPFSGRPPDLLDSVVGIGHNVSIQGSLSRLALAQFAGWIEDPTDQPDATAAREAAARIEMDLFSRGYGSGSGASTLAFLMELFEGHANRNPTMERLQEGIARLTEAVSDPEKLDSADLFSILSILLRMAVLDEEIRHAGLDPELVDECRYPLIRLTHEGRAGALTLAWFIAKLNGEEDSEAGAEAEAELDLAQTSRFLFAQGLIRDFHEAVKRMPVRTPGPATVGWIPLAFPDNSSCPDAYLPEESSKIIGLYGFGPFAVETDASVRFSDSPGVRHGVICLRSDAPLAVGFRFVRLVCP